jgi:hypothetical protein
MSGRYAAWRLLCECLGRQATVARALAAPGFDAMALGAAADREFLGPALHAAFLAQGLEDRLDPEFRDWLALLHAENERRNGIIAGQCREVGQVLHGIGVTAAALKGAGWLFDGAADAASDRMMLDIDLLVPRGRLDDAVAALLHAGYREVPEALAEEGHFHHPPLRPPAGGVLVELHRDLGWQREVLPAEEVLAAATPVAPGLALPRAEHRVLHVVLHGWVQDADWIGGRLRLRDLLDLARLVARHRAALDWPALLARAHAQGIGRVLETALLQADLLLGEKLPHGVVPGGWARLQAGRVEWQHRSAWADRFGSVVGLLARGLFSPRDAYALGVQRDGWAPFAVGRRRLARLRRRLKV